MAKTPRTFTDDQYQQAARTLQKFATELAMGSHGANPLATQAISEGLAEICAMLEAASQTATTPETALSRAIDSERILIPYARAATMRAELVGIRRVMERLSEGLVTQSMISEAGFYAESCRAMAHALHPPCAGQSEPRAARAAG